MQTTSHAALHASGSKSFGNLLRKETQVLNHGTKQRPKKLKKEIKTSTDTSRTN